MANKKDYYEILGVPKDATADAIKKTFRKLSIQYHPDKQVGKSETEQKQAEEKFKEIAEAYAVLSDEQKRKQYDTYGFSGLDGNGMNFQHMDMNDIFAQYGDLFGMTGASSFFDLGGMFGNHFGGSGFNNFKNDDRPKRGGDLRITLNLTIKEIVNGVKKKIKLKRYIPCTHCKGTGSEDGKEETCLVCGGTGQEIHTQRTQFGISQTITVCHNCGGTGKVIRNKCKECQGTGLVQKEETIEIDIPAGTIGGSVITMQGYGNYPKNGSGKSIPGDLLVIISETEDEKYSRNGYDLIYNLLIDIPTAILGGDVMVPLLFDGGQQVLHIEPGTQPGSTKVIKGEGIPKCDSNGRKYTGGNLIVHINVYMPEKLSDDEKKIFEKLRKSKNVKKVKK